VGGRGETPQKNPMSKGIQLNKNDLLIANALGRFKFLTRIQLQEIYFSDEEKTKKSTSTLEETLKKRLFTLTKADIISRLFFFPVTGKGFRQPTAAYFYSPQNQKNLQTYLFRRAQASLWEDNFKELPTNSKNQFTSFFISHEIGLSDFFLSLETGFPKDGYQLAC